MQDPSGAPISKESETLMEVSELPVCNTQLKGHLACLRPLNGRKQQESNCILLPFSPLENRLPMTPSSCYNNSKKKQWDEYSPRLAENIVTTPFITTRKHKLVSSNNIVV